MNQVFKWCLLFRDLCLILRMFSGCRVWIAYYNIAWLTVCDTVTVLLGDIVLLAFEKILVLFSGHRKTAFYNCTNFCLQLHKCFYNCTICAQLHTKKPCQGSSRPWPRPNTFKTMTKTKDLQDHDQDQVPSWPWPRPSTFMTMTKTKDLQDHDQDQVPSWPWPRPRTFKTMTKTETLSIKTVTKTFKIQFRDVLRPRLKSRELQVWIIIYLLIISPLCCYWLSTITKRENYKKENTKLNYLSHRQLQRMTFKDAFSW